MPTFFKRLLQVIEYQGFKNINDFALNGLKYDSSSKLSRLKDEKNNPSVEILIDIANQFPDICLHWLITGIGPMLLNERQNEPQNNGIEEPPQYYPSKTGELARSISILREHLLLKEDIIKSLKEKMELQEKQDHPFMELLVKLEARVQNVEKTTSELKTKMK